MKKIEIRQLLCLSQTVENELLIDSNRIHSSVQVNLISRVVLDLISDSVVHL